MKGMDRVYLKIRESGKKEAINREKQHEGDRKEI